MIAGVIVVRGVGWFQSAELAAFDAFALRCPVPAQGQDSPSLNLTEANAEATPVVIVGITEADIQALGGIPISDQALTQAVEKLNAAGAAVIGLNLFRDLPVEPGHDAWVSILRNSQQDSQTPIIGSEVTLNANDGINVMPPPELARDRVGFTDVVMDHDGRLRRSLLLARDWDGELKLSLGLRLAQHYLKKQDLLLQPPGRSTDPVQFQGDTSRSAVSSEQASQSIALPRITQRWGGYAKTMSRGNQLMLNYCTHPSPPPFIAFGDVLKPSFDPALVRDRVVLIGTTAASIKDTFFTDALKTTLISQATPDSPTSPLMYGVEYHAHVTQQIIQVAQQQHAPLRVWSEGGEYAAILLLGLVGISLGIVIRTPMGSLLLLVVTTGGVVLLTYGALLLGWWLPVVPMVLALAGAGLVTALFDRDAQFELRQRRLGVEQTYSAIYDGPLQQLAQMVHQAEEQTEALDAMEVGGQLRSLDQSLRDIYEHMRHEGTSRRSLLYLSGEFLSLEEPLPELLDQIYNLILAEEMPGFESIEDFPPPDFSRLKTERFTLDQRRGLCLFLQEALTNVGRHTLGASQLAVVCERRGRTYKLSVQDNGEEVLGRLMMGRESRQAQAGAKALRGQFRQQPQQPSGMVFELVWRAKWGMNFWRRSNH